MTSVVPNALQTSWIATDAIDLLPERRSSREQFYTSSPAFPNDQASSIPPRRGRAGASRRTSSDRCRREPRVLIEAWTLIPRSQSHASEARQHLVAEIRHVVEIVDERDRQPAEAGAAVVGKLGRNLIRRADERIAADSARREKRALGLELVRRRVLRRDVLERQHLLDRAPIGAFDVGVMVILLGLAPCGPADHLPLGVDLDLAPVFSPVGLDVADLLHDAVEDLLLVHRLRRAGDRQARAAGRGEEGVAVAHREGLAGTRLTGIHDDRARAADRSRLRPHAGELEIAAVEIELVPRPGALDHVDPLLGKFVALLMVALRDAEHRELALVPAGDEVEPKPPVANM